MKRHTITLGATTTSGGVVVSASSHGTIDGMAIALEGDLIECKGCKNTGRIVCVGPRIPDTWDGRNVALENGHCQCACRPPPRLVPNQDFRYQLLADDESPDAHSTPNGYAASFEASSISSVFDDRFVLIDDISGEPLCYQEYAVERGNGNFEFGTTDGKGHTHLLSSSAEAESINIYA